MALSEDSRTLLQLLLGRGKSYGDIAGLLGVDEAEVRSRAHRALTEINGSDPDRDVPLTDYLLGQADPLERADVARQLAANKAAAETAADLGDQLKLLVPGAELPRAGKAAAAPEGTASSPKRARRVTPDHAEGRGSRQPTGGGTTLTGSQRRLIAVLVLAGLLVVVAIVLATNPFGGDDAEDPPAPSVDNAGAVMQPAAGQGGSGKVQLGRVDDNFAANVQFSELKPSTKRDSYVLWMSGSVGAFPLNEFAVDESGSYSNTIVLPAEALCSISTGVFTDLTLSRVDVQDSEGIIRATQRALRGNSQRLPDVTGKVVFAGPLGIDNELREVINEQCQTPAATGANE